MGDKQINGSKWQPGVVGLSCNKIYLGPCVISTSTCLSCPLCCCSCMLTYHCLAFPPVTLTWLFLGSGRPSHSGRWKMLSGRGMLQMRTPSRFWTRPRYECPDSRACFMLQNKISVGFLSVSYTVDLSQ